MEGLAEVRFRGFGEIGLVRKVGSFDVEGLSGQKPVQVRPEFSVERLFSEEAR